MFSNHKSEVLVATPLIKNDLVFSESVIYLCQNDKYGAMGLIVNKPLPECLRDVFKELKIDYSNTFEEVLEQPVYMGGPISPNKILILHSVHNTHQYDSTIKLSDGLAITASVDILEDLANNILPEYFLPVLGYSCWTSEQLSDEIKANDWLITNKINKKVMFHFENTDKWENHVEASGLSLANFDKIFNHIGHG
ncbi:YqgE/AlgH family protein [Pseudofrancisella aestuarii]|uniref:UPF0301 protein KX01_1232 n=2 Tax=Francisellaceae TaxID=34064 RepID=A0A1J0KS48_9GAMM|nr:MULTISPECIES: YqgE/AlgH family protein [Francisellaceae]APC96452.1 hypothetical protein KX01_1232 [Francisella frigiditurris]